MTIRVKVETFPNPDVRDYHFRRECTPELEAMVSSLPGVDHIASGARYRILVVKAKLYTWEEVEPKVLLQIEAHEFAGAIPGVSEE